MKIFIISKNAWLETLLKQHFIDVKIITEPHHPWPLPKAEIDQGVHERLNLTDIVINDDVNINIKSLDKTWLLTKPISIHNIINIIEQAIQLLSDNTIQIGLISFHPREKLCRFNDQEIPLTQKETEILLYLLKQKKEIDKLTLLHAIWGYSSEISTHTLETHIYKLRSKFAGKYEIISSSEHGYALIR